MEEQEQNETLRIKDMTIDKYANITDTCNECVHQENAPCSRDKEIPTENKLNSESLSNHTGASESQEQESENLDRLPENNAVFTGDITQEDSPECRLHPLTDEEDKENLSRTTDSGTGQINMLCHEVLLDDAHLDVGSRTVTTRQAPTDDEIFRKARAEGSVDVVFPGCVTQDSCRRFVGEILKCVLYQRQQLPMTYDQLVAFQKQQQSTQLEDAVGWRSARVSGGLDWRRCQRTLQEVDEVLGHLEALFSLSLVPRVLFVLGGSLVLPKELYEVNMEAVMVGAGNGSLRTSSCLRQIFRTLIVADLLSDARPVRLTATTVMALGHRDCGATGFRPKMDFKVPAKVKKQVISLASDQSACVPGAPQTDVRDWEDYVWFQSPVTIKGFCK